MELGFQCLTDGVEYQTASTHRSITHAYTIILFIGVKVSVYMFGCSERKGRTIIMTGKVVPVLN
jgi:hypothetical protein